jgi:hypothetical protein
VPALRKHEGSVSAKRYCPGFCNDYPDYQIQGPSKEELVSNLKDLLADMESGEVPYIRKVEELAIAEGNAVS